MSMNSYRDARTGMTIQVRHDEISMEGIGGSSYQYAGHKMIRVIDELDRTETEWFDAAEVQGFDQEQMMQFCQHKLMETKNMQERFNRQYLSDPYRYSPGDELRTPEFEFETIQQPDGTWIKRAKPRRSPHEEEASRAREREWDRLNEAKRLAEIEQFAKQEKEQRIIKEMLAKSEQEAKAKAELERIEIEAMREDEPNFGAFS